jgi:hypothetical protein
MVKAENAVTILDRWTLGEGTNACLLRIDIQTEVDQSSLIRAKLMVVPDPSRTPSNSNLFEGSVPARIVAVKKLVNGFFSGTRTDLLTAPSDRICSTRFSETRRPLASEPCT